MRKSEETSLPASLYVWSHNMQQKDKLSSNWKVCPCDSVIIKFLEFFQQVTVTPVQSVPSDLYLMSLGLMNVSFICV